MGFVFEDEIKVLILFRKRTKWKEYVFKFQESVSIKNANIPGNSKLLKTVSENLNVIMKPHQ